MADEISGGAGEAYRWVRHSSLGQAATVTVVTGSTAAGVLRAFGADPDQPGPLGTGQDADAPRVAVLQAATAVIAVEYNGFRGTGRSVLCRASAGGRAASMFWNINALTNLSFAEDGKLLASFEPPVAGDVDVGPQVAAALDGLDFDDYRDKVAKGLAAVQRFTGRGITARDLERIEAAGIAFRIAPVQRSAGTPGGAADTGSGRTRVARASAIRHTGARCATATMPGPARSHWDWIHDGMLTIVGDLVFVRGGSPAALIEAFEMDPGHAQLLLASQVPQALRHKVWNGAGDVIHPWIRAGQAGQWTFVRTSPMNRPEVEQAVRRLARSGDTAWLSWRPQYPLGHYVRYFESGTEVTGFEMRHPWQRHGPDPDRFLPQLRQAGLPVDPPDLIPEISDPGYAVLEMLTLEMLTAALGIKVSRAVAEGPLLTAQRGPAGA